MKSFWVGGTGLFVCVTRSVHLLRLTNKKKNYLENFLPAQFTREQQRMSEAQEMNNKPNEGGQHNEHQHEVNKIVTVRITVSST